MSSNRNSNFIMHSNWPKIIEQIGSIQRLEKNLLALITLNSLMKIM
jgi:hypothetical protein